MKKIYKTVITMIFIFIIIMLFENRIYATNTQIELIGEDKIKAGDKQTINMNITSQDIIGVVEGTLKCDSNIESIEVNNNYNGWIATYNKDNGKFNIFNPKGITDGDILQLTYVMKQNAKSTTISLSDLNVTTTSYETVKLENNVSKTVEKIEESKKSEKEPSIDKEKTTSTDKKKASLTDKKTETEYKEDDTTVKTKLPATGKSILIFGFITILIIGIITFIKNRSYKDIK